MQRLLSIHMSAIALRRSFDDNPPDYNEEFASVGGRTNGSQEPTTVVDAYRGLIDFRDDVHRHVAIMTDALVRLDRMVKRSDHAMRDLVECRACKGNKGSGNSGRHTWNDCGECSGAGVVPKAVLAR
jgi:DnaJ-class molecular chaperone